MTWTRTASPIDPNPGGSSEYYGHVTHEADVVELFADLNSHEALTTGIHGVGAGTVASTGTTQTLSAKTLASPIITGTVTATGATMTGMALTGGSMTGMTDIVVADGGTGVSTLADGGLVVGAGTAAVEVVAPGATTEILVGGGAATNPVWTTATGSGAPVRATSPTLVTPALSVKYDAVADAARTNTTLSTDWIVAFTSLTATRDYQISSEDIAVSGRMFIVKDAAGSAATFPITISTEGAETIDGAATISINSNYGSVTLYSNGSNLFVV